MKLNSAPIFGGDCLSHFFMVSPTDSYLPKSPGRLNAPGGGGQARMTARPLYDLLLVLSSFWTTHARTPRVSKKRRRGDTCRLILPKKRTPPTHPSSVTTVLVKPFSHKVRRKDTDGRKGNFFARAGASSVVHLREEPVVQFRLSAILWVSVDDLRVML